MHRPVVHWRKGVHTTPLQHSAAPLPKVRSPVPCASLCVCSSQTVYLSLRHWYFLVTSYTTYTDCSCPVNPSVLNHLSPARPYVRSGHTGLFLFLFGGRVDPGAFRLSAGGRYKLLVLGPGTSEHPSVFLMGEKLCQG